MATAYPTVSGVSFKVIDEFPRYCVGNNGSAWSFLAGRTREPDPRWKQLRPFLDRSGHLYIALRRDGKTFRRAMHRLVLEAFIGPCPDGMECCHNDGNPVNNVVGNLRWGTRSSNLFDAIDHGVKLIGERCSAAKMTEATVREIVRLRNETDATYQLIADTLGLPLNRVTSVMIGETWVRVTGIKPRTKAERKGFSVQPRRSH